MIFIFWYRSLIGHLVDATNQTLVSTYGSLGSFPIHACVLNVTFVWKIYVNWRPALMPCATEYTKYIYLNFCTSLISFIKHSMKRCVNIIWTFVTSNVTNDISLFANAKNIRKIYDSTLCSFPWKSVQCFI